MSFVQSINIGVPKPTDFSDISVTGIDKIPVDHPVTIVTPLPKGIGDGGLTGDVICDKRHHGGPDQAVYAYAREDLDTWSQRLGRELRSGMFGENLTTVGIDVNGARIGERWRIGEDVVLEVSVPRIPCRTFAAAVGERGWVKTFTRAAMPGTYLRVITPGQIRPGDPIRVIHRPDHEVTVRLTFQALTTEPALLPRLLDVPELPPEARRAALKRTFN